MYIYSITCVSHHGFCQGYVLSRILSRPSRILSRLCLSRILSQDIPLTESVTDISVTESATDVTEFVTYITDSSRYSILIYQGVHCCTKVCYLLALRTVRVVIPPESSGCPLQVPTSINSSRAISRIPYPASSLPSQKMTVLHDHLCFSMHHHVRTSVMSFISCLSPSLVWPYAWFTMSSGFVGVFFQ